MNTPSRWRRARRAVAATLVAGAALFAVPALPAHADDVAPVAQASEHALTITPANWTIITGLVLPFVLALVLKASSSSKFKAVVGIFTAAVAAIVERAVLADGSAVISTGLLLDVGLIYGPQVLTYLGLWSKFDLNAKVAPKFGIGGGG